MKYNFSFIALNLLINKKYIYYPISNLEKKLFIYQN